MHSPVTHSEEQSDCMPCKNSFIKHSVCMLRKKKCCCCCKNAVIGNDFQSVENQILIPDECQGHVWEVTV